MVFRYPNRDNRIDNWLKNAALRPQYEYQHGVVEVAKAALTNGWKKTINGNHARTLASVCK